MEVLALILSNPAPPSVVGGTERPDGLIDSRCPALAAHAGAANNAAPCSKGAADSRGLSPGSARGDRSGLLHFGDHALLCPQSPDAILAPPYGS